MWQHPGLPPRDPRGDPTDHSHSAPERNRGRSSQLREENTSVKLTLAAAFSEVDAGVGLACTPFNTAAAASDFPGEVRTTLRRFPAADGDTAASRRVPRLSCQLHPGSTPPASPLNSQAATRRAVLRRRQVPPPLPPFLEFGVRSSRRPNPPLSAQCSRRQLHGAAVSPGRVGAKQAGLYGCSERG